MITFALHGYQGVNPALEFGLLQCEQMIHCSQGAHSLAYALHAAHPVAALGGLQAPSLPTVVNRSKTLLDGPLLARMRRLYSSVATIGTAMSRGELNGLLLARLGSHP
ncbi:MAG: hypothetical protein ACLQUY_07200 [Ktedonobacterales bacterium]